jgi:septal ring factor EnvC (AmiA/AmiB activator)
MKPKTILTAIVVVALVVFGVSTLRSCKLDKKYRDLKAAYETERKIAEADKALSVAHIEELNNAIGQANNAIGQLESEVSSKTRQLASMSNQLDELISNEPVQPELESQPLVISLRKQVSKLTEMYSLSQETITLQTEEIAVLGGKFDAQVLISSEWQSMYDKEHALRVNCEGLLKVSERRVSSPWKTVRTVAYGVAAGFVAGALISK